MIFGSAEIRDGALHTHRDSYLLDQITTISARRSLAAPGVAMGAMLCGFAGVFGDLLYAHEWAVLGVSAAICCAGGLWLGQLKLSSRDLKGSELSSALWGSYSSLNRLRHDIAAARLHGQA